MEVGMSETDTRRHYYHKQVLPKSGKSYSIRYCDWIAPETQVLIMENVPADCKRCLQKGRPKNGS